MAKQAGVGNGVYKVVEVIGTSTQSWEDAARNAVETAGRKLRDLRVAEVVKTDMTVKDGKVQAYRGLSNMEAESPPYRHSRSNQRN
jgi:dodecin